MVSKCLLEIKAIFRMLLISKELFFSQGLSFHELWDRLTQQESASDSLLEWTEKHIQKAHLSIKPGLWHIISTSLSVAGGRSSLYQHKSDSISQAVGGWIRNVLSLHFLVTVQEGETPHPRLQGKVNQIFINDLNACVWFCLLPAGWTSLTFYFSWQLYFDPCEFLKCWCSQWVNFGRLKTYRIKKSRHPCFF